MSDPRTARGLTSEGVELVKGAVIARWPEADVHAALDGGYVDVFFPDGSGLTFTAYASTGEIGYASRLDEVYERLSDLSQTRGPGIDGATSGWWREQVAEIAALCWRSDGL